MGMYRVEIEATGGHGCQREVKNGGKVYGCQSFGCPDCNVRRLVTILHMVLGNQVSKATLTHWPGQPDEVQDDLLTGIRKGSFR
jgi:hypothetical protein